MEKQDRRQGYPAELERALFMEAGFRCAVPNRHATEPLEIDHEDWAKVKEHRFENLIVLCKDCHGRKSNKTDPRRLDKKALRKIKNNLTVLNNRYSDLERRILETYGENPWQLSNKAAVRLPWNFELLVKYLVRDGLFELEKLHPSMLSIQSDGSAFHNAEIRLTPTEKCAEFIKDIFGCS